MLGTTVVIVINTGCWVLWITIIIESILRRRTARRALKDLFTLRNERGVIAALTGIQIANKSRSIPAVFFNEEDALDVLYLAAEQGLTGISISKSKADIKPTAR
jgi:hypothetical protein